MRAFLGFFSIVTLALSILFFNFLQCLSLLFLPFSRRLVRRLNRNIAGAWWGYANFCTDQICGIEIVYSGDTLPENEQALVIANHQRMTDILVILRLAARSKALADLKWFVKDPLKYMPGIGWGMLFLDCIFLKRDWLKDKNSILATFSTYREERVPFWLVSFSEGTRSKPSKIQKSQEYAKKMGMPVLTHLMIPRTKGFVAMLAGLDGLYDAVYDITIGYENFQPSLAQFFYRDVKKVHLHVKRFAKQEIPAELERAAWLQKRFQVKDELLQKFYRDGRFL